MSTVHDAQAASSAENTVAHNLAVHDGVAAGQPTLLPLRSEVNIELNFPPKLRGARSRLYRRRFLQVNTRWKALAEIYKIYMFLHRSDLNISANVHRFFWGAFSKLEMLKSSIFQITSLFSMIFMKFARIFSDFLEKRCNSY